MAATTKACTFQFPSGNGSANNMLRSGGSGTTTWVTAASLQSLPTGYIYGCKLGWTSATVITVGAGVARDSTDAYDFRIAATLSVDITASGALGLMTGQTEASQTIYEVYLLGDTTGVNSDSAFLVPEGVTPAETGYDVFRYVGGVWNEAGSNLVQFFTAGTGFRRQVYFWDTLNQMRVLNNGGATSWATVISSDSVGAIVPSGAGTVILRVHFEADEIQNGTMVLRPEGETESHELYKIQPGQVQANTSLTYTEIEVPLGSTRELEYQVSNAAIDTGDLHVVGYILEL